MLPVTAVVHGLVGGATDLLTAISTVAIAVPVGATPSAVPTVDVMAGLGGVNGSLAPVTSLVDQASLLPVHITQLVSPVGPAPVAGAATPVTTHAADALVAIQQPIVAQPAAQSLHDVVGSVLGHKLI